MIDRLTAGARLGLSAYMRVADFGGRSTRTEVWCFFVVLLLLNAAATIVAGFAGIEFGFLHPVSSSMPNAIASLALEHLPLLPVFALTARRLHDSGLPGWPGPLNAALALVLGARVMLHMRAVDVMPIPIAWEVAHVVSLLLFYVGLFWKPRRGPNRYGADPRGIETA